MQDILTTQESTLSSTVTCLKGWHQSLMAENEALTALGVGILIKSNQSSARTLPAIHKKFAAFLFQTPLRSCGGAWYEHSMCGGTRGQPGQTFLDNNTRVWTGCAELMLSHGGKLDNSIMIVLSPAPSIAIYERFAIPQSLELTRVFWALFQDVLRS